MRIKDFLSLLSTTIVAGATTPVPADGAGSMAYSSGAQAPVLWNGTNWLAVGSKAPSFLGVIQVTASGDQSLATLLSNAGFSAAKYVDIECVGGGASGMTVLATGTSQALFTPAGGAPGGVARTKVMSVADLADKVTTTIGTGGAAPAVAAGQTTPQTAGQNAGSDTTAAFTLGGVASTVVGQGGGTYAQYYAATGDTSLTGTFLQWLRQRSQRVVGLPGVLPTVVYGGSYYANGPAGFEAPDAPGGGGGGGSTSGSGSALNSNGGPGGGSGRALGRYTAGAAGAPNTGGPGVGGAPAAGTSFMAATYTYDPPYGCGGGGGGSSSNGGNWAGGAGGSPGGGGGGAGFATANQSNYTAGPGGGGVVRIRCWA